jgi:hypothetical protein
MTSTTALLDAPVATSRRLRGWTGHESESVSRRRHFESGKGGRVLREGAALVPEVGHALGVATSGLAAADADEVQAVRAGRERADDGGRNAQHVPRL